MNCKYCDNPTPQDVTQCPYCGAPVEQISSLQESIAELTEENNVKDSGIKPLHFGSGSSNCDGDELVCKKSRSIYIVLAIFLGGLGIHNYYAGYHGRATAQLLLCVFLSWTVIVPIAVAIWVIVEIFVVKKDANGLLMDNQ